MAIKEKLKSCNVFVAILTIAVIAVIIAISVILILGKPEAEKKAEANVCKTPECIHLAHRLHNFGDPNVDPCVDFFNYSCGRYKEHVNMPMAQLKEKRIVVANMMEAFMRNNKTKKSNSENILSTVYRACLPSRSPDSKEQKKAEFYVDLLKNIRKIGSMPILDNNWNNTKLDLNEWLVNMGKLGVHDFGLFNINTLRVFSFTPSRPSRWLRQKKLKKFVENIFIYNNISVNKQVKSTISNDVKDALRLFNKIFAMARIGYAQRMPYKQLKKNLPTIDFDSIFETLASKKMDFEKVNELIKITSLDLYTQNTNNLETIINKAKPRVIANLILFKYIVIVLENFAIPLMCSEWAVAQLPQASLKIFARDYFDEENRKLVSDMVDELKVSYAEMFSKSEWLSEATRKKALLKLEKMTKMVGYPEEWKEQVEKSYQKLDIQSSDSLLTIITKTSRFRIENDLENVFKREIFVPGDEHLDVNAYYMAGKNHLMISTAIIDDPFFDSTYPKYARIAGIAQVLAHEIGHGFDSNGMNFDENGMPKNWWTSEDRNMFMKKSQCFVKQYDNYNDPDYGKQLNGTKTLEENLADQLANKNIWMTYKRLDMSKEPDLIGFEGYDTDKLFFQISALNWCQTSSKKPLSDQLEDEHGTGSFRVNGVVSNMKEFAEAYKCPVGSPMNPKNKCGSF